MKRILHTAKFLLFAALGMHACEKQPESPKNPFTPFIKGLTKKIKTVKKRFQPIKKLVIIIPAEPQNSTQQEVGKSNALNTNTSEPQFEMFTDMPEEIIQGQIMSVLDDPGFLRFALSCKLLWNLAKTGFNQRFEQNKQEQREIFKKKIAKNSTLLDLSNMNIKFIYPGVFDSPEFEKITCLYLNRNKLTKLDKDTFKGLPNLTQLGIWQNELVELHKDIFQDLKKLWILGLPENQLTQQSINSDIFRGLKNLESLDLSFNKLTELNNDTFNDLDILKDLYLSQNQLTYLDKNILRNLTYLSTLTLKSNPLTLENVNKLRQFKKHQKEQLQQKKLLKISSDKLDKTNRELRELIDKLDRENDELEAQMIELGLMPPPSPSKINFVCLFDDN